MRLTTQQRGEHHVTIPDHDSLRLGTLSASLPTSPNTSGSNAALS
jgi:hypothetical protein